MQKVAEGLTGDRNVNWMILSRKAFVFAPSSLSTFMFKIERAFSTSRLEAMEPVAIRLASFVICTSGTSNVPSSHFPNPAEFRRAFRTESVRVLNQEPTMSREELAETILSLASKTEGIVFYINSRGYLDNASAIEAEDRRTAVDKFWVVSDQERELFTRLATMEAVQMIDDIDKSNASKMLYSPHVIILFRVLASAGACAFWFNGSWPMCSWPECWPSSWPQLDPVASYRSKKR